MKSINQIFVPKRQTLSNQGALHEGLNFMEALIKGIEPLISRQNSSPVARREAELPKRTKKKGDK